MIFTGGDAKLTPNKAWAEKGCVW